MQPGQIDISPPPVPMSPAYGSPAWLRFALFYTLFLLAAIWLEPLLAPLCRATAVQVGALLGLAGFAPQVQGDLVILPGFTVRIVTECTPLHACLLYCTFVLAQPASWGRTLGGLLLGTMVITAANLLRISLVTAAGPVVSALVFDILHVYLGQVAMLMLVVAAALLWLRWSAGGPAPFPFLLRALFIATALFVPWVVVNRSYVALLDNLIALPFSLLYPGYKLLTPRPLAIYNHTFAVPLFLALVLAGRNAWTWRRLAAAAGGVCLIAGWHALFRISHVVWTALDVPEIMPLHQAIYLLGQFLLPFLIWLRLDVRYSREGRGGQAFPAQPAMLVLLITLCWSSSALAEPVVSAYPNGRGAFVIKGDNLNRVTEAEIRIDYKSDDQTTPQVSGAGQGARAAIEVQADNPGSLTMRLKSSQPMNGHALLATAQIKGTITFLTAWLRNEKGMTETPRVLITNPTEEQLSAMAARRPAPLPVVAASPVVRPPAHVAPVAVRTSPVPSAAGIDAVPSPEPDYYASRTITFSRRKSVLEHFRAHAGELTPTAMARLFERSDDMFLQEPPVLLSDGIASLRLTVRAHGRSERAPQFFISGGSCTGLKIGDDGSWKLEIVPERGSLATSVTVLSGGEMVEYPLLVAPPLELFDKAEAGAGEEEYVTIANRLAIGSHIAP